MGEEKKNKKEKGGEGMRVNKREGSERKNRVCTWPLPSFPSGPVSCCVHDGDEMARLKLAPQTTGDLYAE